METTAIILSKECKNYRKMAQNHWGLTDDQMKGMHVHHFPERCNGGRNIPEHLFICSPYIHAHGWHKGDFFVEKAALGGSKGKRKPTSQSQKRRITPEERKELNRRINKSRIGKQYGEEAKKKMSLAHKNSEKSINNINLQNTKEWMDPDHPELGIRTISGLVRMQKKRKLPHGPENRVKVVISQ